MDPNDRKRKAPGSRSNDKNKKKAKAEDKEVEKMEEVYDRIRDQITDFNRALLTTADIADSLTDLKTKLDSGDFLLSWQKKDPRYTSLHTDPKGRKKGQEQDECWAYAYARGLAARVIYDGRENMVPFPSPADLLKAIDKSLLGPGNMLADPMSAAPLIRSRYGYDMVCHRRPSLRYPAAVEKFEKFVGRRVAIVSMAACFFYLPSYRFYRPYNKQIFRPTPADLVAMSYEQVDDHCAVIAGSGAIWINGEFVEYWHVEDSQGEKYGGDGYIRLERRKGLIRDVYEFRRI